MAISWTDRVENEVLQRVKKERHNIQNNQNKEG